jgi:D-alanyl-D-alanine carboxypeptidase
VQIRKPNKSHPEHSCYTWVNSNKLLEVNGFNGAKTGITEAAGPCLAATYEKDGHTYTVVILQSNSMETRWVEVISLVEWAINRRIMLKAGSKTHIGTNS